jgi:hypothetical protein
MMAVHSVMCYTAHLRMLLWIINYLEPNSPVISPRDPPFIAGQPLVGLGFLTIEASRSHSARHTTLDRTVLWTSDQPTHRPLLNTQYSQETDIHVLGGIRTHNPSKRAANPIGTLRSSVLIIFFRPYEY